MKNPDSREVTEFYDFSVVLALKIAKNANTTTYFKSVVEVSKKIHKNQFDEHEKQRKLCILTSHLCYPVSTV